MKKIYYIVLISLIAKISFADYTLTIESSYTNRFIENTDGSFSTNLVISPEIGSHFYVSSPTVWYPGYHYGVVRIPYQIFTNGYAYLSTGTERHRYVELESSNAGVYSLTNGTGLVVTNGIDTTMIWHWDSTYLTEVYVMTNTSYGSINITNGWYGNGTNIQLIADPNLYCEFDRWEALSIKGDYTNVYTNAIMDISVTNAMRYYAYFNCHTNFYLDVSALSNGSVHSPHFATLNGYIITNAIGQIVPNADPLYEFSYWSGNINPSQTNTYDPWILMDQDRSIMAHFTRTTPIAPEIIKSDTNNFEWESVLDREYTVQSSTNLLVSTWSNLTMVVGTGSVISYTDNRELDKAFYRLSVY